MWPARASCPPSGGDPLAFRAVDGDRRRASARAGTQWDGVDRLRRRSFRPGWDQACPLAVEPAVLGELERVRGDLVSGQGRTLRRRGGRRGDDVQLRSGGHQQIDDGGRSWSCLRGPQPGQAKAERPLGSSVGTVRVRSFGSASTAPRHSQVVRTGVFTVTDLFGDLVRILWGIGPCAGSLERREDNLHPTGSLRALRTRRSGIEPVAGPSDGADPSWLPGRRVQLVSQAPHELGHSGGVLPIA